jgi:LCP family protein required for cell wall assembly
MALLLVATGGAGYLMLRHFNRNLTQVNLSALIGKQPADTVPQAENILIIGADDGLEEGGGNQTTDEPDSLMLLHIAANRKSAEVMSIPRDSWVTIPSCDLGNGRSSAIAQSRIGNAYAIDGQNEGHAALGAACLVKTVEQDTGIYIGHFIVASLAGFQRMVAALGGVEQCVPAGLTDPNSGITLPAGCHLLTPAQALAYVRARTGTGATSDSDLARIAREQSLVSSLVKRAQGKVMDPDAIYRFADAASSSLTIDSQLGGVTGLYNLTKTLRAIPSGNVYQFTLPTSSSGTHYLLWKQPQASKIFAAIRADKPVSSALTK